MIRIIRDMRKNKRRIFWGIFCAIYIGVIYNFGGIHYAVNDDLAMREIASGIRSGVPDGHLVFIRYPLGWIISRCYLWLNKNIDWYGLFLLSVMAICFALGCYYIDLCTKDLRCKSLAIVANILFSCVHIFMLQWTICATYCCVISLLALNSVEKNDKRKLYGRYGICLTLWLLGYMIRRNVFWLFTILSFPIVLYVIFIQYRNSRKKWIGVSLVLYTILFLGVGATEYIHRQAYKSEQWRNYEQFNQVRSELYDYYGIPDYSANQEFYKDKGISKETYDNLCKYAFIYDPNINIETLNELVEFQKEKQSKEELLQGNRLRLVWEIISDYKYIYMEIILCGLVIVISINSCRKKGAYRYVCGLSAMLWIMANIYLLIRGRMPDHIVYMMFLIGLYELFILLEKSNILIDKIKNPIRVHRFLNILTVVSCFMMITVYLKADMKSSQIDKDYEPWYQIQEYMSKYNEKLYLIPTNTFGIYTDKFEIVNNDNGTFLRTGGWACNSPLTKQQLDLWDVVSIPEDFVENQAVRILNLENNSLQYMINSISKSIGQQVTLENEKIIETTRGNINIYKLIYE
mgnify:CR=1 FL=1